MFGRPRFIHDLTLPGLLHARVLRPPSPGATLTALDETKAKAVPGVVAVVRDGSFAGVVAETEDAALAGLKALAARRAGSRATRCPTNPTCADWIKSQPVETTPINTREAAAPGRVTRTVRRDYDRPSSPMPRWRRPAPSRAGAIAACDLDAHPGRLQPARRPAS